MTEDLVQDQITKDLIRIQDCGDQSLVPITEDFHQKHQQDKMVEKDLEIEVMVKNL